MSLRSLRNILAQPQKVESIGTVIEVTGERAALVRTAGRVVSCTSMISVSAGEEVRLQGTLIVGRRAAKAAMIPEYLV